MICFERRREECLSTNPSSPNGQNGWFITPVTVTLTRNEAGTSYYQWDTTSGPWTTYSVPFSAPEGQHTLYYYSVDTANNTETVKNQNFKVDISSPTTSTLSGNAVSSSQINLSWTSSTDTVSGVSYYEIYNANTNSIIATSTATSYSHTGLSSGDLYRYYLKAVDNAGNKSTESNTIEVRTIDVVPPSPPTILSYSGLTTNSITLSWTGASDNVGVNGYIIFNASTNTTITTTSATSYTIGGLSANTTYSYYVKAFDASGNISSPSETLSITTPPDTVVKPVPPGGPYTFESTITIPKTGEEATVIIEF